MAENAPYVAREADLNALLEHWTAAKGGDARTVLLTAPLGAGKRAMVGELCRRAVAEQEDDVLLWRVTLTDEEDGFGSMLRFYAALLGGLHRSPAFRGKVEMALNSQVPSQPQRVQRWYQAFIDSVKKSAPKPGEGQFQVTLPRDNPVIALVEIAAGIARKFPVILEIQNVHHCHSLALHAMLEALMVETRGTKLLTLMCAEPVDDQAKLSFPMPMLEFLERRGEEIHKLEPARWGATEVSHYLASKELTSDAARIAEIADGLPGYIAELVDWLEANDRLADIGELKLADIANTAPDADELEEPDEEPAEEGKPPKPKHAGPDDAERIAYLAALLGLSFPSALIADMAGFDRESIDDLLDATEDLYKELQFSKPMGTWIYQFHKALLRKSVLDRHQTDEDKQIALRVGAFMERFLAPRGYAFVTKTMRLYAEAGEAGRASLMRSVALGSDRPDLWAMTQDLLSYFDEVQWPAPMRRTSYMNLMERLVQSGDPEQAERLWGEAMKWATDTEDRAMQAWMLLSGSKLDYRRQDLFRARDRAVDALKMYQAADDKLKSADVLGHLAMIDLMDGQVDDAVNRVKEAEELSEAPQIQAHAAYVRALVEKRERRWPKACEFFGKANEIAGRANLGPLALEAGLNLGECLLLSGQHAKAADVLGQVVQIAKALSNPVRERAAAALLSQAHGALKNWEAAHQLAMHTLQLTESLKFTRFIPIDRYNVGFFNLMLGRKAEAIDLFRKAREAADGADPMFNKELHYNLGQALLSIGEKTQAEQSLKDALPHATRAKDWRKVAATGEALAAIYAERGSTEDARSSLRTAIHAADEGDLKDVKKALKRKLDELGA